MRHAAAVFCLITLAPIAAFANGAKDQSAARFSYTGYMGGLKVGYAIMDVALRDGRYAAKLAMETGGIAGLFFDWRHGSSAFGAAKGDAESPLATHAYLNASVYKGKSRVIEVAYDEGVAKLSRAEPHPVKDEGRPAVAANLRRGALDPLSAIIALGQRIDATGACDTEFPVFDGRRIYRFVVADEGETEIEKSDAAPFGGDVRRCAFEFKRVAGFKKKPKGPPTKGHAYFRRTLPEAPMMPVQVIADSKYGATILHLRSVTPIDPELAELAARKLDVPGDD